MSETYPGDLQEETETGKVILAIVSCLSALLVIAGLIYATGTGGRQQAALAAAGCEPGLSSDAAPCVTQPVLAGRYLAVASPAVRQLAIDAAAYSASEGNNLVAAEAALAAEVATDRAFDAGLAGIEFPPAITPLAAALLRANEARVTLIAAQARSSSLAALRSFNHRVQLADAAVQTEMDRILKAVDAPVQPG